MNTFNDLTDEELQTLAASGDGNAEEQLALRYSRLVKMCARPFFLAGGDSEDLIQEGMFGLLSAIREYDPAMSATFRTYAEICIRHRLISAVKAASRMKHSPLNEGVSFDEILSGENLETHGLSTERLRRIPEEQVLARESAYEIYSIYARHLSKFETQIYVFFINGMSYHEMAERTHRSVKSVDNAVQRIRRKLARHQNLGDFS